MFRLRFPARALLLMLVLAVASAPVLPAFGMVLTKPDTLHTTHDGPAHDRSQQATDADALPDCPQHQKCQGQCCAFCAQCFTAVFFIQPEHVPSRPVQAPASSRLHSLVLISLPDRPPRRFSP